MMWKNPWVCRKLSESLQILYLENDMYTLFLLQKWFTHTCFVAKTIYAHFFVAKSILAHFFVAKMIYAHFFCRKNDLSAVFVTKTIYTLCSESFCALIFFLEVKNRKETENSLGVMVAFSIQSVQDFIVFETPLSIEVNVAFPLIRSL